MTKVRITKKLVAIATTMLMLTMMIIPAAAEERKGSIIVTKHKGDSLANAEANITGQEVGVGASFTPLQGAGFTLFHIADADVEALVDLLVNDVTVSRHVINVSETGVPTITWTLSDSSEHTATAVAIPEGVEQLTDADGVVVFGGTQTALVDGFYILVESTTPSIEGEAELMAAAPSLIRMPMTYEDGTPNYDIFVYPKNVSSAGIANKDIASIDRPVSNGDEVDFEIKSGFSSGTVRTAEDLRLTPEPSAIPANYGSAILEEYFRVYFDSVGNDEIEVRWTDVDGNFVSGAALSGELYTITRPAPTAAQAETGINEVIRVELTDAGIDAAITAGARGFGFAVSAEYIGSPTAHVGAAKDVVNSMGSIIVAPNTQLTAPVIDEIRIPTISITATKVDENGDALAGATFRVATRAINPQASDFVMDVNGNPLEVETEVIDGQAIVSFSNLPNYSNADGIQYYVIEIFAPAGYDGGTIVSVEWDNKADHADAVPSDFNLVTGDWAENIDLVKSILVTNTLLEDITQNPQSPGFSLPLTGGAGTLLFTAIGIIVMIGATGLYIHGKKRNIEK